MSQREVVMHVQWRSSAEERLLDQRERSIGVLTQDLVHVATGERCHDLALCGRSDTRTRIERHAHLAAIDDVAPTA
jgi:hypothetical protein